MPQSKLQVLIQLAQIDGEIADTEKRVILEIGKANGFSAQEIEGMLSEPQDPPALDGLSPDDKFEYMYHLVELMKVDGRMKETEIKFISRMAASLGYDEAVLFELVTKIHNDKSIEVDRESLKRKVQQYLK